MEFGWLIFAALFVVLFVSDLMTHRGPILRTLLYIAVAIGFGAFIWAERGHDDALKYYTAYALEMTLSLDNIFVISLIFTAMNIPEHLRERVLLIGILTAVFLRAIFIGFGTALVGQFDWLLLACGAFLIYTAVKIMTDEGDDDDGLDLSKNKMYNWLQKNLPVTDQFHGKKFIHNGHATPLLIALLLIEVADVMFATDSVPASLAVTSDVFLVYTSNLFAILGLRAMYSVLAKMVNAFHHLEKAIAVVLGFIGVKVIAAHWPWGHFEIDNMLSLALVIGTLGLGVAASWIWPEKKAEA